MAPSSSRRTVLFLFMVLSLLESYSGSLTDGKCRGVKKLTGKTGDILTPNYPKPYPRHSRCSWLVQVPEGYKIVLQFYDFVLENTYDCNSDNMIIYDGRNSSATLLGKYCEAMDPFKVESTGKRMLIVFRSDRSLNYRGFKAKYTAVPIRIVKEMSFRRTLNNFTVVPGKEVKFLCQINDGSVNIEFVWTKDGKVLDGNAPGYSIRSNTANKRSYLLLREVSQNDAGVYGCSVNDHDMGKNMSSYGALQVKVPAEVTEGPSSMIVNIGDHVVLQCGVMGDPVPSISWHVNGQDKTSLATRTNLTSELNLEVIKTVDVNCTADNGFGVDSKIATITALSPPTENPTELRPTPSEPEWFSPVIVTPPQNVTAELGVNVTLTCTAKGHPKPTIRWLVDESKYYENVPEDENEVSYFTFTVAKDKTIVRCEAQNKKDIDTRTAYVTTFAQVAGTESPYTDDNKPSKAVIISVAVAAFVLPLLAVFGYWYFRHQRGRSYYTDIKDTKIEFDAFIIYSTADEEWVKTTLLPILEEKKALKCCVHYRDFVPGKPFRENMADSVYKSRKTIAVVSRNFFRSKYCHHEMDMALGRLVERGDNSVIVIRLDDVDRGKLPKALKQRSYIDYFKSNDKELLAKQLTHCFKDPIQPSVAHNTFV